MLTVRHDVFVHLDNHQLDRIEAGISTLINQGATMSAELDALQAEVERNTTVDGSVQTLLTGLSAQIAALKNDPVKLQALADQLKASNDATAAAVVANTPVAP